MKALMERLHAKVGDLWWYSAMIFVACRSGDVIQAFIGLWLVPKYVGPSELGAVLPLQQLSGLFTVPLAILATVFAKYVNTYATRGEYGKVKCFIRDVLAASSFVFVFCIAAAYLLIPHFYSRLNVASGMLTALILASGFVGNVSSLFSSALQGLKKFRTMSVQSLISAPIRLVTMLVAMPFRALSGYILGQTTPPATCSVLAAISLRKDLHAVPADPTWRRDLPEIWRYLWPYAIITVVGTICGAIQSTVYRQRLPEIESSAYYMLSRFSEVAGYVGCTMMVILTPLASEAHEQGKENIKPLYHTIAGAILSSVILAALFYFTSDTIFSLNSQWSLYGDYAYLLPLLTIHTGLCMVNGAISAYEIVCRRFKCAVFIMVTSGIWTVVMITFTGYEFFRGILPDNVVDAVGSLHLATLSHLTWGAVLTTAAQFVIMATIHFVQHAHRAHTSR